MKRSTENPSVLVLHRPGLQPAQLVATRDGFLFERAGGGQFVAFGVDGAGQVDLLFTGANALERAAWWEAPTLQISLFLFFALLFALSSLTFIVRCGFAAWRKFRGTARPETANFTCRWLAIACALSNLAFLGSLAVMLFMSDQRQFLFGMPLSLQVLLRLPLLGGALAVETIAIVCIPRFNQMTVRRRVRYGAFACIAAGFVPFLMYWNLVMVRI